MTHAARPAPGVRRILSLVLAIGCAAAIAAPAADDGQAAHMAKGLHRNLALSFVLDKGLPIDPKLRTAADQMSAEHLARVDQLLPRWLNEERALQSANGKAPDPDKLFEAVSARLLNELALWQIEPGDANYERATLAALQTSPRVCLNIGNRRFGDFASRILRIQAMPTNQRSAALATERQLLARWGKARDSVAPWPDPLPQDAAVSLIKRQLADGQRHALALPPVLASDLLGQQKDYAAMDPSVQCALQQWWLQESLRQGAAPAAVLNAFRYGTLIGANDRFGKQAYVPPPDGKGKPPYPKAASRFRVTGATTVRVELDGAGNPRQASVSKREIRVPGIRGVRPIAFEHVFDEASLNYALKGQHYSKPTGSAPVSFQMVWDLDGSAETPANTQSGARQ